MNSRIRYYNLIYPIDGDRILLGLKQRGFAAGKYMGYGGKMERGETKGESAVRELKEESNLSVKESDLNYLGYIKFHRQDQEHTVYIFTVTIDKLNMDELVDTDEMIPQWFERNELPFDKMLEDFPYWYEYLFKNQQFTAEFHYDRNNRVIKYDIYGTDQFVTDVLQFNNNNDSLRGR